MICWSLLFQRGCLFLFPFRKRTRAEDNLEGLPSQERENFKLFDLLVWHFYFIFLRCEHSTLHIHNRRALSYARRYQKRVHLLAACLLSRKSEVHVAGAVRDACRIAVMHVACCMLHACCTLQDAVTPSDNSRWIG